MFAYSGWNAADYLAGEVRSPAQVLPQSLFLGTGLVVILYLPLNRVFVYAVPLGGVGFAHAERITQLAVENLFGATASGASSVSVGMTFLVTVSASVVTGPRIYYAMARDDLFPSIAGRVSQKGQVPIYAILAQSFCAIVILFITDFQNLYKYAPVGLSLFALLCISAIYVLRWRPPYMKRPFRVPGYPVVPAIFIVATIFLAVFAFMEWSSPWICGVGTILAGIPIYYIWSLARRWPCDSWLGSRSSHRKRKI